MRCCTESVTRRDPVEAEFMKLLDRARRNEASAPRKHHVVPASYLARWAEDDRIRVTDVSVPTTYVTAPSKAARVTDFYRLEAEELAPEEVPPLLFETILSDMERWGKAAIDDLLDEPHFQDPELAARFAYFLGFQFTRGAAQRRELRFMANEMFKLQYGDLSDEGIRDLLTRQGEEPDAEAVAGIRGFLNQLMDGVVTVGPQDAALIGLAGESAVEVGRHFLERQWILCRTPKVLLTCDEPIVPVGGPGLPRGERAGVATAGVMLFPLSPDRLLVMMRRDLAKAHGLRGFEEGLIAKDDLDHVETVEVCREVAMNADRWVIERPRGRMAAAFKIPPLTQPAAIDEVGPIKEGDREGRLLRSYRLSRWANRLAPSPWPVERWWLPGKAGLR